LTVIQLCHVCGLPGAAPGGRSIAVAAQLRARGRLRAGGPGAGGDAGRTGWVAWRAIVSVGKRPVGPGGQVRPHLAMAVFLGAGFPETLAGQ